MINELSHPNENAFKLQPTSYNDVREALSTIRSDCSTGHDSIPINLLKPISEFIISPLTLIINNFTSSGTFPEYWKVARISPVPKVNNPSSPSDFRPISVLPVSSKVYKRVVLQQLVFHIENLILYKSTQHGFRKSHSTTSCLMKMKNDIINAMNKGEITTSVFADYSKAFDTIDFKRLLRKLTNLNIDKSFLHWMTNYLSDRQHYVQIDNKKSSMLTVGFGVPQGSILGPVIFNLYVSDLSEQVKYSKTLQYVDDTKICIHSKPNELEAKSIELSRDIENIRNWSHDSNLVFNEKKTRAMLFYKNQLYRHHKKKFDSVDIKCGDVTLERTETIKVLGITFNEHLHWTSHINKIAIECFSTWRTLRLLKRFIPFKIREELAQTLILSKVDYGNTVFNTIPKTLQSRLQKVLNAAAGFVCNRHSKQNDCIKLSWLPIEERLECSAAVAGFKGVFDEKAFLQI